MSTNSERLARYIAAETAILKGQEVAFDTGGGMRKWRGADLGEIRAEIQKLQALVDAENAVGTKPTFGGLGFVVARMDGC